MYSVNIETSQERWDTMIHSYSYSPFVQSYKYGKFYESLGEAYWLVGIYNEDGLLVGGSVVLTTHAKRGNFFYLPYGPLIPHMESDVLAQFIQYIKELALKEKMDFVRISPLERNSKKIQGIFQKLGMRPSPMHVLAENTWLLDLEPSEETLLASMKKNHRNLIRRCQKEGVRVEIRDDTESLEILHTMLDETGKRHGFTRFTREYINAEFEQFKHDNQAKICISYHKDGTPDAAAIIIFFGNTAVYRHSASLNIHKKIPTSYLIQWSVIQEAKKRGMKWYNFWGVEPDGAKENHPFAGIGHFKRGFGGFQEDFLHAHDLPLTRKYWLNWLVETVRKYKRGF